MWRAFEKARHMLVSSSVGLSSAGFSTAYRSKRRSPVAGLHRASPSATLDENLYPVLLFSGHIESDSHGFYTTHLFIATLLTKASISQYKLSQAHGASLRRG